MKAIILTAGVGSRIRPLTDNTPKPLIAIGNKTILGMMMEAIVVVGIKEIIVVVGYRSEQIKDFLQKNFPSLKFEFVPNDHYQETNTGYSLWLTRKYVVGDSFIKFDGDVVFEKSVLEELINSSYPSALCIDKNINLEAEEVKVITDSNYKVEQVGKKLNPKECTGESIGIEKIDREASATLFAELGKLLKDKHNWQEYYDDTYTSLVAKGVPFYAVDISGKKWVEIDTHEDYKRAQELFK